MKLWSVWADQRSFALLSRHKVFSFVLLMAWCPSMYGTWSERSVSWTNASAGKALGAFGLEFSVAINFGSVWSLHT